MKLATMFLIIFALQVNIMMFSEGTSGHFNTGMSTALFSPTNWGDVLTNPLFILLAAGIALVGVAAAAGFISGFKTDTMLFATLILVIIGWSVPIISLWEMIYKEGIFGNTPVTFQGITLSANAFMASFISAPLLILAFWAIWGWWRSNSEM